MSSGPVEAGLAQLPCACCLGDRDRGGGSAEGKLSAEGPMGAVPGASCSVCLAQLGPGGWS